MPWMKRRRPAWRIRLGLFLYDHLGGRKILPGTVTLHLPGTPEGAPIEDMFQRAYEYSDCWIEDSRLVVLNARDAEARGAEIMLRTKMLVNAAGPWVADVIRQKLRINTNEGVRLVRGSHIVTKRLYDHDKCYFFQGTDGRIIFAVPYETDFTLIGTTDAGHHSPDAPPVCTPAERYYLIAFANKYFKQDISAADVVWTYSGVRPL
jgi:glycerol-3-phosphate dehydrogenase